MLKGVTLMSLNRHEDAIQFFDKAINLISLDDDIDEESKI